jgi:putative addiction module CopG family antidote
MNLPPELKRFVDKKVKEGLYANENEVVHDALRFFRERDSLLVLNANMLAGNSSNLPSMVNLSALGSIDVEAQAFIVLMKAAKSAQEDLKSIMNGVKAINRAKEELRKVMNRVNKDAASNAGQRDKKPALDFSGGMGSEKAYHRVMMPFVDIDSEDSVRFVSTDLFDGKIVDVAYLREIKERLKNDLDSMTEMGEMESLRLQMAMDRLSKMMSTLSNLLKKVSDTADSITHNLK